METRESKVGALVLAGAPPLNNHRFLWCTLILWQSPPWSPTQSSHMTGGLMYSTGASLDPDDVDLDLAVASWRLAKCSADLTHHPNNTDSHWCSH